MNILFKNITVLYEDGTSRKNMNLSVKDKFIDRISDCPIDGTFDRVIDGDGKMLIPGLYNCHCHSPMSLFRGIGEDLPLQRWLEEKIYPAEDKLDGDKARAGTVLACAEMIKNGIVSFSDMYFFCDSIADTVASSGMKANISRCVVSFDPNADVTADTRCTEGVDLFKKYHKSSDGRILIDMALHAEYTNTEPMTRHVADIAKQLGANMHIHLSETKKEHEECIARRGMTPTEFFASCGAFDVPTTAAHCVYITPSDADILAEKGVNIAHCPVSNLKLASGIGDLGLWIGHGVNITMGTDGAASNNTLDVLKEISTAALIHRGKSLDPSFPTAQSLLPYATVNGAISQGRTDCGRIKEGYKADLVLIDMDAVNNVPSFDPVYSLIYSVNSSNVIMTVCDGEILYDNGEFTTVDIEKALSDVKELM